MDNPLKSWFKSAGETHQKLASERRKKMNSIKARWDLQRTRSEKFADLLTENLGTVGFFTINAIWFATWMLINTGLIPWVPIFDPFPYGLLTMIVSLEAIFLSIIVLISQNRSSKIDELREEIDLQINVRAEQEITRMIIMLDQIYEKLGLGEEDDAELIFMKQKTDLSSIEKSILKEMERTKKP